MSAIATTIIAMAVSGSTCIIAGQPISPCYPDGFTQTIQDYRPTCEGNGMVWGGYCPGYIKEHPELKEVPQ